MDDFDGFRTIKFKRICKKKCKFCKKTGKMMKETTDFEEQTNKKHKGLSRKVKTSKIRQKAELTPFRLKKEGRELANLESRKN